jgi:hypothetical protein
MTMVSASELDMTTVTDMLPLGYSKSKGGPPHGRGSSGRQSDNS